MNKLLKLMPPSKGWMTDSSGEYLTNGRILVKGAGRWNADAVKGLWNKRETYTKESCIGLLNMAEKAPLYDTRILYETVMLMKKRGRRVKPTSTLARLFTGNKAAVWILESDCKLLLALSGLWRILPTDARTWLWSGPGPTYGNVVAADSNADAWAAAMPVSDAVGPWTPSIVTRDQIEGWIVKVVRGEA